MNFSRWVFRTAGIYGLACLVPQFFLEEFIFRTYPPALAHPEYFYGFLGVAVAWQVAFLVIAHDPFQFKLFMIPAVIEKVSFSSVAIILFIKNRIPGAVLGFGLVDLLFGLFFIAAFRNVSLRAET